MGDLTRYVPFDNVAVHFVGAVGRVHYVFHVSQHSACGEEAGPNRPKLRSIQDLKNFGWADTTDYGV